MRYEQQIFGYLADSRPVKKFLVCNDSGASVELLEWGARILSLKVPDKDGNLTDVVLGYDTLEEYADPGNSMGAVCGRVANRLRNYCFTLNGRDHELTRNCDGFTAHGGSRGFQASLWEGKFEADGVTMTLVSAHGDQGFPGELTVTLRCTLTQDNTLRLEYRARADRDTLVNLMNHSYFNLAGAGTIRDQELWLNSRFYTPGDENLMTTGEISSSAGTAFDFTVPRAIGSRFDAPELAPAGGYDHFFVLAHTERGKLEHAATLSCQETGISMKLYTTEPGIVLYTANGWADGSGKNGGVYGSHCGISMQPQRFPDSMHHTHFPDCILPAGQVYRQTTEYRFGK